MNNYWLIPMDFKNCNYEQLREEWKKNKKIIWEVPGKPRKTKDGWKIESCMAKSLKKGDIVYFYVSNLPSESNEKISRIMLRGIIEDEPYPIEKNKIYVNSDSAEMVTGISIGSITTLNRGQLENNLFLSIEDLKKKDSNFKHPQGKNWPDKMIKKSLSGETIALLEKSFKSSMRKNDFEMLINHFKKKCFFCEKKYGDRCEHRTFVSRNGLDYFEYHHFIPQNTVKKYPALQNIINFPANGLFLCSNCHNKIHYGLKEEVKQMLDIVLKDDDIKQMLEDFEFQNIIGENKNIIEWFQEIYNVKEDLE